MKTYVQNCRITLLGNALVSYNGYNGYCSQHCEASLQLYTYRQETKSAVGWAGKDSDSASLLSWFMCHSQTNAGLCTVFLWSLPWPWPMQIEPEILHGTRGCNCILKKHVKNFRFWFRELTDSTFISITGLLARSEILKIMKLARKSASWLHP